MSIKNAYLEELDKLYRYRTHWLRSLIGAKALGRPPSFDRKKVKNSIKKLKGFASTALAKKLHEKEFSKFAPQKRPWQIKGWGLREKKKLFKKWLKGELATNRNFVYVFWKKNKCVYVGRTGNGGSRPTDHFIKMWFHPVTRVDIYPVKQRSQLPKLECLAKHRYSPSENRIKPSNEKWTKKCPMCEKHEQIAQLRNMFPLKKARGRKRHKGH